MLDNATSLSTHASLAPNHLQAVPSTTVNVTFTLDQGTPKWGFVPGQVLSADLEFGIIYALSTSSTPGWNFTGITIEDCHQPPAWSFTYPNSAGLTQYTAQGVLEVTVTELEAASIALSIENLNTTKDPEKVSVRLTVSDSQGKQFTSPDPQVILEPRPH
jgi:hypothetical protein